MIEVLADSGPLTGGTWVGAIAMAVITFGCLIVAAAAFTERDNGGWGAVAGSLVVLLISWGVWLWAMWPLAYDYHHWVQVDGKVDRISKRLVSDGDKGMQERYVLVVDGVPRGVDDTRASLVRVGDRVQLACKREYEYGLPRGAHGWGCRWRGRV